MSAALHTSIDEKRRSNLARIAEVPAGEIWVHCATGYRASIAASLLDRAGRKVVVIDDGWPAPSKHESVRVRPGAPVASRR